VENIKVSRETIHNIILDELEYADLDRLSNKDLDVAVNVIVDHYKTVSKAFAGTLDETYLSKAVISEYIEGYVDNIKFVTAKDYPAVARLVWNSIWSKLVKVNAE
jgi:hypothetical protein